MELSVEINSTNNHSIDIIDETTYVSEYDVSDYTENKFLKSEIQIIDVIRKNNVNGEEIIDTLFSTGQITYEFTEDGYFTIYHIILPTKDWWENNKDNFKEEYGISIYVTDGELFYETSFGEEGVPSLVETELTEIISRNIGSTTISYLTEELFSICYLYDCYINICKRIFLNINYKCLSISEDDLIFKRDLLWMTINVIRYYIELNNFLAALKLLEEINFCGGLCNNEHNNMRKTSGCGCGR